MLSFGLSSSMFDFLTFGTLLFVYGENEQTFHTGWFIESVLTGLMIMLVVRTERPFFLSRPGKLLVFACAMVALVTVFLPFSPFATDLEFVRPPAMLLGLTMGITLLYGIGMEIVKRFFYRVLATDRTS
jgi:Mg2+-importing ATPase